MNWVVFAYTAEGRQYVAGSGADRAQAMESAEQNAARSGKPLLSPRAAQVAPPSCGAYRA